MKKSFAKYASFFFSLVALTSVSMASPFWSHRAEAPKELLEK